MTPPALDPVVTWLLVSTAAFWFGTWCYAATGRNPILNPMVVAGAVIIGALTATGTPYTTYAASVDLLQWLMGPAIVALAVPLYQSLKQVRAALLPALIAIAVGAATAAATGTAFARLAGADLALIASMAPKSVTTPVALAIAERAGGVDAVAAVFVLVTGIVGALTSTRICRTLRVADHRAQGLVLGVTAHILGVARGFSISQEMGTFAAVGMGVSALVCALLVPIVLGLLS